MPSRRGVSIVETLVVIAIIGLMLGFLLPAVQSARTRALEIGCKNNLRQINLAIAEFYSSSKRLPDPGVPGRVGGWTIDVLPFLEQKNLRDRITPGIPIRSAPDFMLRQPGIMTCPIRAGIDTSIATSMDHASYVLDSGPGRQGYSIWDAPLDVKIPWASGPEMRQRDIIRRTGPHNGGFFHTGGFQDSVSFTPGGQ